MKVRYIDSYLNGSTGNGNNHWVEIAAIDVNGVNVAKGKPVGLSGTKVDPNQALSIVTDGDIDTNHYLDIAAGSAFVQVDLQQEYDIVQIIVWHYYADGRSYYDNRVYVKPAAGTPATNIFDSNVSGTYPETAAGKVHILEPWQTPVVNRTSVLGITNTDINRIERNLAYLKTADHIDLVDAGNFFNVKTVEAAIAQLQKGL